MADTPLLKKLHLQEGQRALLLNAPQAYLETLGQLPEGVRIEREPSGEYDFVHLFVKNHAELERDVVQALQAVKYDGILWISYPKGGSGVETDLNRDRLWDALKGRGIRPVTQISIDSVWSALRFRPAEKVGH